MSFAEHTIVRIKRGIEQVMRNAGISDPDCFRSCGDIGIVIAKINEKSVAVAPSHSEDWWPYYNEWLEKVPDDKVAACELARLRDQHAKFVGQASIISRMDDALHSHRPSEHVQFAEAISRLVTAQKATEDAIKRLEERQNQQAVRIDALASRVDSLLDTFLATRRSRRT